MANRNGYQDNSDDGTQRYYPQGGVYDETGSYDQELYPDVGSRQAGSGSHYGNGKTRASRVRRTQRQTAADLTQVDNSQVAGRVAYDEEGNLVVVKKEEKSSPVQMAAIVGSALSAVTSAFFSSHIGIGGSVLTVAIGAAVSAAATQLYTHLIKKSTDKLKSVAHNATSGSQQLEGVMDSSQLDGGYGYGAEYDAYGSDGYGTYDVEGYATSEGSRIAPQGMIDAASEAHERQIKRRGIIIVAIAALVAVIAAAGIVTVATNGNGIGAKTPSIVSTVASTNTNTNANLNANANANANMNENSTANENANENEATNTSEETQQTTNTTSESTTTNSGSQEERNSSTTNNGRSSTTNTSTSTSNTGANSTTTNTNSGSSNTSGTSTSGNASSTTSGTTTSGTGTSGSTTGTSTSGSPTVSTESAETQSSGTQGAETQGAETQSVTNETTSLTSE